MGKTVPLGYSNVLNYQLAIMGYEKVIFIDHYDKFHVNLLFDRSIYRPMCTHMGMIITVMLTVW